MRTRAMQWRLVNLLGACALMGGCRTPAIPTAVQAPSADRVLSESRRCDEASERPFVVEWAAADRALLEARLEQGVAVVAREGCELRVLPRCTAGATYDYLEVSPKRESVSIRNATDLYANLPVGAARLEGELERTGQLTVDMAIRARFQLHAGAPVELGGSCEGATHLVTGATVGAFELRAGATRSLSAEARVPIGGVPVGGGASHESERGLLTVDGDLERCSEEGTSAARCRALVQLELGPLPPEAERRLAAPQTTPEDLQGRARAWRATAATSGVLAGVSLGGAVAGGVILSRADWDDIGTAVWEESDPNVTRRKELGTALMAGSMVGTVAFTTLAGVAAIKARQLEGRSLMFGVMATREGGAVSIGGRF